MPGPRRFGVAETRNGEREAGIGVVRVEPLVTARALRGPFDYSHPGGDLEVGALLEVPFGRQRVTAVVTAFAASSEHDLVAPLRTYEHSIPADLVALGLWVSDQYASTPGRALRLVAPAREGRPRRVLWAERTTDGDTALMDDSGVRLTPGQRAALEQLPARASNSLSLLRRLEARGLLTIDHRTERRAPTHRRQEQQRAAPELTEDQLAALAAIDEAEPGSALLLDGVTGSGKTEVYLKAAERTLSGGQGVLILVPEIGLTPQMIGRFSDRFGDTVAVLHSRLSDGERYDEWSRLRSGEARVCVGPRSAVFAPIEALGLIVVDEEHDGSYKHEGDPRYDARSVAEHRAQQHGAVLVAGSATPRPESIYRLPRVELPQRVDGAVLPPVEVIDLKETGSAIHPRAHEALVDSHKAIVLLNRRGWSNFLTCGGCGHVWSCPNCDVALILHRAEGHLACHHCGHHEPVPRVCNICGSISIARHGAGTERLAVELAGLDRPVFRLDGGVKDPGALLARFAASSEAILLGTQLVAKGHDFPDVDLGVVLDADATLRFPDFRSQERTFALVTQLAGRAGRGARRGMAPSSRVLVQTIDPEDETIQFAAHHDSAGFLRAELRRREALRYPPFSTLIRIHVSAEAEDDVDSAAADVRAALPAALGPAPLFRLRGRERRQLVLKVSTDGELRLDAVREAAAAVEAASKKWRRRDVRFVVDVDPQ